MPADPISVDFETRSTVDLRRTSVYRYAEDPATEIICMAYAVGDGDVELWTPGDASVPAVLEEYAREGGPFRAYNAMFERVVWNLILRHFGFPPTVRDQWHCTAAEAAAMAMPRGLGKLARVLGVQEQKDEDGHRLMMQMCRPRSIEDDGTVVWWDGPERRARLYDYCMQDVETERDVAKCLRRLGKTERELYLLDQKINDRGVMVDVPLVKALQKVVARGTKEANRELKEVTDGAVKKVTQTARLTEWLQTRGLEDADSVAKEYVREWLSNADDLPDDVVRALTIRKEAGKSSTAKLRSMLRYINKDARARGMLLYHGAATGRWSGRGPQPQNYPRPESKDPMDTVEAVLAGDYDSIAAERPPLVVASDLLRSCFIAAPGSRFLSGDYSQIEARVVGWYANEPYGDREYERMAAAIYNVPVDDIENPSERRTIGKNTVLGCGFQMGAKTFAQQLWERTGLRVPAEEANNAVDTYRSLKPGIVQFWYDIESAAMKATQRPGEVTFAGRNGSIRYVVRGQYLWCILPSGRPLCYANPQVKQRQTKWGPKVGLQFLGVNGYTKKWETRHAYGGFLTENVVQATARDLMAEAMLRVEDAGYPVVLTVHDEILTEVPEGQGAREEFHELMAQVPTWLPGLPVEVETWEGGRYRK